MALFLWLLDPDIKANCLKRKKGTGIILGALNMMFIFLGMEEKDNKK